MFPETTSTSSVLAQSGVAFLLSPSKCWIIARLEAFACLPSSVSQHCPKRSTQEHEQALTIHRYREASKVLYQTNEFSIGAFERMPEILGDLGATYPALTSHVYSLRVEWRIMIPSLQPVTVQGKEAYDAVWQLLETKMSQLTNLEVAVFMRPSPIVQKGGVILPNGLDKTLLGPIRKLALPSCDVALPSIYSQVLDVHDGQKLARLGKDDSETCSTRIWWITDDLPPGQANISPLLEAWDRLPSVQVRHL